MHSEAGFQIMEDSIGLSGELLQIARYILAGGVAAVPTETVYGLLADASSLNALDQLRALKGKPSSSPVPIFVPPNLPLRSLTSDPNDILMLLEKAYWPGPLLIVCEPSGVVANLPVCRQGLVGLRKSSSRIVNNLIELTGKFITATSANRFGNRPALNEDDVKREFDASDLFIMDKPADSITADRPSTVITSEKGQLFILREGAISADEIARKLAESGFTLGIKKVG
ncbi:MAG: hypothetical protein CO189_12105 [candidate division Zixibacteria bacterium CG_4_9_14_3_um_filter_46_8]|nr:MAG: hypothetical protein CO189_12105 [candidate division Zixibacteria bacterium CG_4_9_14_3_um_filter_46_8]